ncbi:calcium-binding protein [Snodgrassella communis]|uniref:calcium-binding protein n=1 Tax=Snodgrassella communis TaxID=2946699 RepID=UPI000C1F431A|nr:calcium-binding protein [Snodgrassella communis]
MNKSKETDIYLNIVSVGQNDNINLMEGSMNNDNLNGTNQDDILIGREGNDRLYGGEGNDTYVFAKGHGQDYVSDSGGKSDTIQFLDVNFDEVKFSKNDTDLIIYGYNEGDSIVIRNFFYWTGDYAIENFVFKDKTVTLEQLRTEGMELYGTAGNDGISISVGKAIMHGGDGNDNLSASAWSNANDVLDGGAGNDILYAYGGDDILIGGTGDDKLYGGEGDDTYVFAKGHGRDYISDSGGKSDTIQFLDVNFDEVKFRKNDTNLIIYGYYEGDSIEVKDFFYGGDGYAIENFVFKDRTVTLEQLRKEGMELYGTAGNDSISISVGKAIVHGGDGNDNLSASAWSNANDVLDGGAGNDILYAYGGDDILIGGTGDDKLYGGEGDDTYVFAKGHGRDYISDSGGKSDTIQFLDVKFEEVKFRKNDNTLIIYGYNEGDSIEVRDFFYGGDGYAIENFVFKDRTVTLEQLRKDGMVLYGTNGYDDITLSSGKAIILAGAGDDRLSGGARDDILDGGEGNDHLYGRGGNDILIGGAGDDSIWSKDGDDIITGGLGNDYLYGGGGNDIYIFSKGHGQDMVWDGNVLLQGENGKEDTIIFTDVNFTEVTFRKEGNTLYLMGYNKDDSVEIRDCLSNECNQWAAVEKFVFKDRVVTLSEIKAVFKNNDNKNGDYHIYLANNINQNDQLGYPLVTSQVQQLVNAMACLNTNAIDGMQMCELLNQNGLLNNVATCFDK